MQTRGSHLKTGSTAVTGSSPSRQQHRQTVSCWIVVKVYCEQCLCWHHFQQKIIHNDEPWVSLMNKAIQGITQSIFYDWSSAIYIPLHSTHTHNIKAIRYCPSHPSSFFKHASRWPSFLEGCCTLFSKLCARPTWRKLEGCHATDTCKSPVELVGDDSPQAPSTRSAHLDSSTICYPRILG